jgi:hypothetical protein
MGKDHNDSGLRKWVDSLYSEYLISDEDLEKLHSIHKYQGFDRVQVLADLRALAKSSDVSTVVEIILICALKGPAKASQTKLSSGRTVASYGVPKSVGKGSNGLSCNRITAATADLAAYYLKKLNIAKKIDIDLPGWLQFPSAASIDMPDQYLTMHKDFAIAFSEKIGGDFNEDIYLQMRANKYLDTSLRLF